VAEPDWPTAGVEPAQRLELLKAKLAWIAERAKERAERVQSEVQADLDLNKAFHEALIETAKAGIDRSRSSADSVQKAATGILALYTAVLGLAFSVGENPLPSRGVIPAIFLGMAVVFSTAYLAYLSKPRKVAGPDPQSSFRAAALARSSAFIRWAGSPVQRRAYWLRASVVALGVALAFIPAPFLSGGLPFVDRLPGVSSEDKAEALKSSSLPAWPAVPGATEVNLELWKIRYQAEVKEVADARAAFEPPGEPTYANQTWWIGAGVGLILVFALPFIRLS
jgi:hypothetical protein